MKTLTRPTLDPTAQKLVALAREAIKRGDARATGVAANLLVTVHVATSDEGERTQKALQQACAAVGLEAVAGMSALVCAEFLRDHLIKTRVLSLEVSE